MSIWKSGDHALIDISGPTNDRVGIHGRRCTLLDYLGDRRVPLGIIRNAWKVDVSGKSYIVATVALRKPPRQGIPASVLRIFEGETMPGVRVPVT